MAILTQSPRDIMLREAADRLISQGYSVRMEPSGPEVPDFFRDFKPDLIAVSPDEHLFVDVKTPGKVRGEKYFDQLNDVIKSHPGWRLLLVTNNKREHELALMEAPVYSVTDAKERLDAAKDLRDRAIYDSSLIITWTIIEARLRELSRNASLMLPVQGPAALMSELVSLGHISRKSYEILHQCITARNLAAHGFRQNHVDRNMANKAIEIAEKLIKNGRI